MESANTESKRSSLSSDSGFTLPELLMASFLGLLIMASVMSAATSYRNVLGKEIAITRLNQNLRGAMDILGADLRVAGENLPAAFPAIEMINGVSGGADQIIVRRNLLDEVLPVCVTIESGTATNQIYFAIAGNVAGCTYSGHTSNFNAWRSYRTSAGGATKAFIYHTTSKAGEFFDYVGESDTGTQYYIRSGGNTWSRQYPAGGAELYILEEWHFDLSSNLLRVMTNRDTSTRSNVAFDISNLQVFAAMQDGSQDTSFSNTDAWTSIAGVNITLTGTESFRREIISRTLSAEFLPRNILSN